MNKPLAALASACLVLALAACGAPAPQPAADDEATTAAEAPQAADEADTTDEASSPAEPPTIEETVLVDEDDYTITAESLDARASGGPTLTLLVENRGGDDLQIQCRDVAVNGYMTEAYFSVKVEPGEKIREELQIAADTLALVDIEQPAVIEVSFVLLDDDWNELDTTPSVTLETSLASSLEDPDDPAYAVIYEAEDVTVSLVGMHEAEGYYGPRVILQIANGREEGITVMAESTTVNGHALEPYFLSEVSAGKRAIAAMEFSGNDLDDLGIDTIEEVTTTLVIRPDDDYTPLATSEQLTLTF